MEMQKYRADVMGETSPNGAVPFYSNWIGGPRLALIRNCPNNAGISRHRLRHWGARHVFPQSLPYAVTSERGFWDSYVARTETGFQRVRFQRKGESPTDNRQDKLAAMLALL